jgi:hypothetical protein
MTPMMTGSELLSPILGTFSQKLSETLEKFIERRIARELQAHLKAAPKRARKKRLTILCYYPGCRNVAAPRHGMFCTAEHKGLSKSEKARIRAARNAQ